MDSVSFMVSFLFGFAPGIRANKKPPTRSGRRFVYWPWRFFCSNLSIRTSLELIQASHRGSFSKSSVGTLRLEPQEFLMLR